jgi:hypothetical protein
MAEWHVRLDGIERKVELYLAPDLEAAINADGDQEGIFISDKKELDELRFVFGLDGKLLLSWKGRYVADSSLMRERAHEGITFVHYNEAPVHCKGAVEFDPENQSHLERRAAAYRITNSLIFTIKLADSDSELLPPLQNILDYGRGLGLLLAGNGARQG